MQDVQARVKRLWCTFMHPEPMWPVGGYYRCPKCLHRYPVPWEGKVEQVASKTGPDRPARHRKNRISHNGMRVWRSVFGH